MLQKSTQKPKFEAGEIDPVSGARWVYVTRQMAQAHAKGKLGIVLWVCVLWSVYLGISFLGSSVFGSGTLFSAVFFIGLLSLFGGLGLAFRLPWSPFLIYAATGLFAFLIFSAIAQLGFAYIAFLSVNFLLCFYLAEGDRPNLIYRYRYRAYRGVPDDT